MERSYFFDSTEDDERIYQASDFARFHAQIIGDGVSNTANLPDLEVTAQRDMNVSLGAGYMFVRGYMYENTSTMTLTHDIADSSSDRIDRIVIRFDNNPEERKVYAAIKKGTIKGGNPTPPSLIRNDYIHEMSIAQVRIIAGKSYIEQSQITDERANDAVCGYIPLHNIYRGIGVNEHGMITMSNQSYVEMNDLSEVALSGDGDFTSPTSKNFYYQYMNIKPIIDRQEEIKNGKFYVKQSGTYLFSSHVRRLTQQDFENNKKIEAFIVINGQTDSDVRLYLFNQHVEDETQFYGTNIKYLEEGDEVRLVMARRYESPINLDYLRLNIAKIN